MATRALMSMKPKDADNPVEIKAYRKWISFGSRSALWFLFIDKHGGAMEATARLSDKAYFDERIKIGSCYRISNYICDEPKISLKVVPHLAVIKLGKAAKLQTISDDGFPLHHFNFIEYDHLLPRLDNHTHLTDYIGSLTFTSDLITSKGSSRRKFKIENLSGKLIDATFWDEAATSFDKEAVAIMSTPIIIAISSMKVTQYNGCLQLTATPSSYIYIKPEITEAEALLTDFKMRDAAEPILKIEYNRFDNVQLERQRNRYFLADLIAQNPERYIRIQFTCKTMIKDIDGTKNWCYKSCTKCLSKLKQRGDSLACEDHDVPQSGPRNVYCFKATILDHTGQASATFFNDAAAAILKTSCDEMTRDLGYVDESNIPHPITELIGKTYILQMRYSRLSKPGAIDFVIDNAFEESTPQLVGPPSSDLHSLQADAPTLPPTTHAPNITSHTPAPSSAYMNQKIVERVTARKRLFAGDDDDAQRKKKSAESGQAATNAEV